MTSNLFQNVDEIRGSLNEFGMHISDAWMEPFQKFIKWRIFLKGEKMYNKFIEDGGGITYLPDMPEPHIVHQKLYSIAVGIGNEIFYKGYDPQDCLTTLKKLTEHYNWERVVLQGLRKAEQAIAQENPLYKEALKKAEEIEPLRQQGYHNRSKDEDALVGTAYDDIRSILSQLKDLDVPFDIVFGHMKEVMEEIKLGAFDILEKLQPDHSLSPTAIDKTTVQIHREREESQSLGPLFRNKDEVPPSVG